MGVVVVVVIVVVIDSHHCRCESFFCFSFAHPAHWCCAEVHGPGRMARCS